MMSSQLKTIVVFGATGKQGGSVAQAILNDPLTARQFKVRAVTRDPTKPAAKALVEQGAEVVRADLDDKKSLQTALTDAYALFLVTNFMDKWDGASEERQGKNVADVAKELNVKHFIWSSLPNVSQITDNKYSAAAHFDNKAVVDEYLQALSLPYTVIRLAVYTDMLWDFVAPLPTDPPSYGLCFPGTTNGNTAIPTVNISADLGKWIKPILLNPEKTIGKRYNVAEKFHTLNEITNIMQQQGLKVAFQPLDMQTFKAGLAEKGLPESFQTTMEHVMRFVVEYGYYGTEGLDSSLELVTEQLTTLEESLKASPRLKQLLDEQ